MEQRAMKDMRSIEEKIADRELISASLTMAVRDAVLTHARLGRSVPQMDNDQIQWYSPPEIFARYGLDEFGRELPQAGVEGHRGDE